MNEVEYIEEDIIKGWECPLCQKIYYKRGTGICPDDFSVLKPIVPQIPEP